MGNAHRLDTNILWIWDSYTFTEDDPLPFFAQGMHSKRSLKHTFATEPTAFAAPCVEVVSYEMSETPAAAAGGTARDLGTGVQPDR